MSIQKHGHVWDLLGDTILNYSTEHLVTVQLSREITQPSALLGRGGGGWDDVTSLGPILQTESEGRVLLIGHLSAHLYNSIRIGPLRAPDRSCWRGDGGLIWLDWKT